MISAVAPNTVTVSIKMLTFLVIMLANNKLQINKKCGTTVSVRLQYPEQKIVIIYMLVPHTKQSTIIIINIENKNKDYAHDNINEN